MDEQPKKRRKLLIVDVDENGAELPEGLVTTYAIPTAPEVRPVVTVGTIHTQMQKEILSLYKEARIDEEKIETRIWNKVDEILKATTLEEATAAAKVARNSAWMHCLMNKKDPEKQAKAADRIAKMWRNKGETEKAKQQEARAKKLRADFAAEKTVKP